MKLSTLPLSTLQLSTLQLSTLQLSTFKLSIVVPVLNEADALPALLQRLSTLAQDGCEVIIADGGSADGSLAIAGQAGFTVVHSTRGRARQMNAGAAQATGEALLFLHADTWLPDGAAVLIAAALQTSCWGRFDVRLAGRPRMLRVIASMMNWRSRISGIATGDQAMFVSRAAFDRVQGFPDQPLMEDIELSARLRKLARPACIRQRAITSGRRWEANGVWRTMLLMWRLRFAYWRGVPPSRLAEAYR
jgi:rSAM/selenodomain-associated transferase 2